MKYLTLIIRNESISCRCFRQSRHDFLGNRVKCFGAVGLFLYALFAPTQIISAQDNVPYFSSGNLYIVGSSHQDIAWENIRDETIRFRDEQMITPALGRMAQNSAFCFSVEDARSLKEYLERHPERYPDILKYTREGRLEWGATLSQPYPSMYDGEALIRQTYFGRKWLKKTLPGCDFQTAWNLDVPGMALQLPQILAKSGIPYYMFSRFQPGFYRWYSPDGSSILGWSPGHYDSFGHPVRIAKTEAARTDSLVSLLNNWSKYYAERKINPEFLYLSSHDMSTPIDWDNYMADWNTSVRQNNERGLPLMQYAITATAFKSVTESRDAKFDRLSGERPNVWLYIHGPTHHKALTAGREASRVLTAAEKFATMNALLQNSFSSYPVQTFSDAWESAIYPDHGWGGKNGHITDQYFREKFEFARAQGREILYESLNSIASKIKFNGKHRYAITVFNPLSWEQTDPVTVTLDATNRQNTHFRIVDASGNEIPYQWTANHQFNTNREELLTFTFIAENIPAVGYKTFYIVENEKPAEAQKMPSENTVYENRFYRVTLGKGGIVSLYDKELKMELFKTDKFSGGELFTMQSIGTGAGEFTDVQQPTMEDFDKSGNYPQGWQLIEAGAVKDVLQIICPMRDTRACIRIVLFKNMKRIDFEVDLDAFNCENWREFRLAFPINMQNAKISYEVPMGVVEVGKGEIAGAAGFSHAEKVYSTPCKDVHPREVQDWFSVSDGKEGITISSSVAVFDWIDPTDHPVAYPVLQPVLLASRKSCHGQGNYYLQPGNHSFRFSLYSHQGDWKNGYRQGTQTNQPSHAVVVNTAHTEGHLPETFSFASVLGRGVVISTIKKCEDDDAVVLRCYDIEGKDVQAKFSLFRNIVKAQHTNMIEEEGKDIPSASKSFDYKIGHHAIETFKLRIEN